MTNEMKQYMVIASLLCLHLLPGNAQPQLTAGAETHRLGRIEWKKPVTVEYKITNTGNQPLVLTNVTVSCACAVVDWTKTPIQPNEKGVIRATFDAEALGHFHKSVGVYSNAPPGLLYLYFSGEVATGVTDFSHLYPYSFGDILADTDEISFSGVHRNEQPELSIGIINNSDLPYEPTLMHLPSYFTAETNPTVLLRGERGSIKLTLNTDRLPDLGLTRTSVYLSRFQGDKVSEGNEIPVTIVLLPDFRDEYNANSPRLTLSKDNIDFSNSRKSKVSHTITLTNSGKGKLQINKLQVLNPALSVELKKSILWPGEKVKLKVTLHREGMKNREMKVLMITNDPQKPDVTIPVRVE